MSIVGGQPKRKNAFFLSLIMTSANKKMILKRNQLSPCNWLVLMS